MILVYLHQKRTSSRSITLYSPKLIEILENVSVLSGFVVEYIFYCLYLQGGLVFEQCGCRSIKHRYGVSFIVSLYMAKTFSSPEVGKMVSK